MFILFEVNKLRSELLYFDLNNTKINTFLQVLHVDVLKDPGVDDDMILYVIIRHGDAAVPDLPLSHRHPVVVHLLLIELKGEQLE